MDYVCEDASESKWYFVPELNIYKRVYEDGRDAPMIKGEFLPNPETLWANKIQKAQDNGHKPDILLLRPSAAIYSLWNHWRKRY